MNPAITDLDHVQLPIPVGGSRAARHFYERVLGLNERRHPALDQPGCLRYALGRRRLDLREGAYTGIAPQAHLALVVGNLAEILARFKAHAVTYEVSALEDRAFVEDPFRNRIELISAEPGPDNGLWRLRELNIAV